MKKIVFSAILLGYSYALSFSQTTDAVQTADSLRSLSWNHAWQKQAVGDDLKHHLDSTLSFKRNKSNLQVYDDLHWLTQQKRLFASRSSRDKMPCAVPKGKFTMKTYKPDNLVHYQMLVLPVN